MPHQRANVDQVPLPFVNDDTEETLAEKGADRVCIKEWVLFAPAPCTVTQGYVGFLGSRGGHAAVS